MSEHPVCIADRIGNHINEFFLHLQNYGTEINTQQFEQFKNATLEVYRDIRGEQFIDGKTPKAIAAGIIHFGSRKVDLDKIITIKIISEILFTSALNVKYRYRSLLIHFIKNGIDLDYKFFNRAGSRFSDPLLLDLRRWYAH